MVWILNHEYEVAAVRELEKLSDRAAAIVAAVLLESKIEDALKFYLIDHQKNASTSIHTDMFRNSGPLGSFSAKINMAFMLGMYTAHAWRDIDYIREIRNSFAHNIQIVNFESDKIRSLCNNIQWFTRYIFELGTKEEDTPKNILTKMFEKDHQEKLNNPRERYLLAVRFYSTFFVSPTGARTHKPLCTPRV